MKNSQTTLEQQAATPVVRTAAVLCCVVCFALMLWRGPYRATLEGGSSDWSLIYQSGRAWEMGLSPYRLDGVAEAWARSAPPGLEPPSERTPALFVYPPPTFVLIAPWCALPWEAARWAWLITNTALLAASAALAMRLAGLRAGTVKWWLGMAAGLALAPGHTAVSVGQMSVPAVFAILVAQNLRVAARPILAGVALGAACALKPQIGLVFLAYEMGRLRWRTVIAGAVTLGVIAAIGAGRLELAGVSWLADWRANVEALRTDNNGSPGPANPLRHQLVDMAYWLASFVNNDDLARKLAIAGTAGLCAAYFAADFRKRESAGELLSLTMVACATLLVVYHRFYDATLMLIPLAWGVSRLGEERVWPALVLVLTAAFLAPGAVVLESLANSGKVPAWLAESALWRCVLMPHAVIAIVLIAACAVMARAMNTARSSGPQPSAT